MSLDHVPVLSPTPEAWPMFRHLPGWWPGRGQVTTRPYRAGSGGQPMRVGSNEVVVLRAIVAPASSKIVSHPTRRCRGRPRASCATQVVERCRSQPVWQVRVHSTRKQQAEHFRLGKQVRRQSLTTDGTRAPASSNRMSNSPFPSVARRREHSHSRHSPRRGSVATRRTASSSSPSQTRS